MSLVVAVYTPNGIVLAADSRTTATRGQRKEEGGKTIIREEHVVLSDNSFKLVKLSKLSCGVGTFGAALINNQPIDSYIRNFEEKRIKGEESVEKVAQKLVKFFVEKFPKEKIGFIVAGYQKENDVSIPYVYYTHTKQQQKPKRVNSNSNGAITYGIFRGGDTLIVNRLIAKEFLPPFQAMPLQDAVDYAVYLIRTTIDTLRFEPRFPTVGGPIDVLAVTPEEIKFIQKKELHGD